MAADVLVVYLQFTDRHQEDGLARLRRCARRWFPGKRIAWLVVDNAHGGDHEIRLAEGLEWMAGDNSVREFSGYEKGLRRARARLGLADATPVVLANDTFHRSYGTDYLASFTASAVRRGLRRSALVGHVDEFPREVSLQEHTFRAWVRTSLVIARLETLWRLLPLALPLPEEALFSADYREFFRADAPLSPRYRDYLRTWLFSPVPEGAEFREEWHSKRELSAESFGALKEKTRCILSEHALSARAAKLGIPLHDPARSAPWRRLRSWGGRAWRTLRSGLPAAGRSTEARA